MKRNNIDPFIQREIIIIFIKTLMYISLVLSFLFVLSKEYGIAIFLLIITLISFSIIIIMSLITNKKLIIKRKNVSICLIIDSLLLVLFAALFNDFPSIVYIIIFIVILILNIKFIFFDNKKIEVEKLNLNVDFNIDKINSKSLDDECIKTIFPNSTVNSIIDNCLVTYNEMNKALANMNMNTLKKLCTDEFYNKCYSSLEIDKISNNRKIQNIQKILDILISNIQEKDNIVEIVILIRLIENTFTINNKNNIIDESDISDCLYETHFKYNKTQKIICPNCGAELNNEYDECPNCNTKINIINNKFMISSKIKLIKR